MEQQQHPSVFRNILSLIGLLIAAVALANIIFFAFIAMRGDSSNPYAGILAYMVLPGFLILGLLLVFIGAWRERRRRHHMAPDKFTPMPVLNLNDPRHRKGLTLFVIGGALFAMISSVGAYEAYEYTETVEFCGTSCHEVMHPQYTAYKNSPHARVRCVECHVGSGAGWYVRSKLSGAYQLYAVLVNNYPRPITTPVHNLRPAQDTCEQCHWPAKFWGAQLKTFNHFMYDEQNTPRETQMLIKTGGAASATGQGAGIHWHMNIVNEITYVATDSQLQEIPWVRMRNRETGEVTEFRLQDSELTDEQIAAMPKENMDCVSCHNRPSHIYTPPDRSVDTALLAGALNRQVPWIKQQAVEALTADYENTPAAMEGIRKALDDYYRETYPAIHQQGPVMEHTISGVQAIYRNTIFPEMKADWRTHPDNIAHLYSEGCFRCHTDNHVSADGKVISKDCEICHEVIEQRLGGSVMTQVESSPFVHPVDLGDLGLYSCNDCHSGAGM
ncbi:MAG: NapC/NirT family cytochrome c [Thermoanaerobaculia bacterium]